MISLGARACLLVSPAVPSRVAIAPRRRNGSRLPHLCAPCYYFCKCTQKKRFVRPLHAKNATPPRFYAFPHRLLRASTPCGSIRSAGLYVLRPPAPCPLFPNHHAPLSSSRVLFSKPSRFPFPSLQRLFPLPFPSPCHPFALPPHGLLYPRCGQGT